VEVPNRVVTWLDAASTPLSSGRLLPKPNGDLHVVDSAIEDTQVLKCLITGAGGNQANAPEMIVYEHVLFGEFFGSMYGLNINKTIRYAPPSFSESIFSIVSWRLLANSFKNEKQIIQMTFYGLS